MKNRITDFMIILGAMKRLYVCVYLCVWYVCGYEWMPAENLSEKVIMK